MGPIGTAIRAGYMQNIRTKALQSGALLYLRVADSAEAICIYTRLRLDRTKQPTNTTPCAYTTIPVRLRQKN